METGRIRITHTGSLPRPRELTELLARRERGDVVADDEFASVGRRAVTTAIARQVDVGIDIGNNGEAPRPSFATYVKRRMTGLNERPLWAWPDCVEFPDFGRLWAGRHGRLSVNRQPAAAPDQRLLTYCGVAEAEAECSQFLACAADQHAAFVDQFMTAVSPGVVARLFQNPHYDSEECFVFAVAEQMRVEYEVIHRRGLLLQIDAPDLASHGAWFFHNAPVREFVQVVERNVAALNTALRTIPPDRVRLHVCWANFEAPHVHDVELREILPVLCQAKVGALSLEMANPRHAHEYAELSRFRIPDSMVVVPGVIDAKTNYVEHPEVVADRIVRVAEAIGDPSRVIAGVDCGFATVAGYTPVAESVVWRKLRSLRAGADLATGRLWT